MIQAHLDNSELCTLLDETNNIEDALAVRTVAIVAIRAQLHASPVTLCHGHSFVTQTKALPLETLSSVFSQATLPP